MNNPAARIELGISLVASIPLSLYISAIACSKCAPYNATPCEAPHVLHDPPRTTHPMIMIGSILLICLFVQGCVQATHSLNVPDINKSESVVVRDLRPASEKESARLIVPMSSDAYGIFRKGDGVLLPPATRLLQHRVFEKFGASQEPLELTIHHLVVYLNAHSALKRSAVNAGLAELIGARPVEATSTNTLNFASILVDRHAFESLAQEEYKRALYPDSENIDNPNVYVIYIDAEITGRRVFVKSMTPATASDRQNLLAVAVESTIQYYLSQY